VITDSEYIKRSLALHLFFARIMKEHSLFLETGFSRRDFNLINQADYHRRSFDALLADTIALADGVVCEEVLKSGEVTTPFTLKAETVTSYYTGIPIATELTGKEASMTGDGGKSDRALIRQIRDLNNQASELIRSIIQFKSGILSNVRFCSLFTTNYPLMIGHLLEEAKFYLSAVQKLEEKEDIYTRKGELDQEYFWNDILAEHAKFIRGMLDPTEIELMIKANDFANEFDELTDQLKQAADKMSSLRKITSDSLIAANQMRDFNISGTQGILDCKIKSIIMPLLSDHVLREANHYLRLLNRFQKN